MVKLTSLERWNKRKQISDLILAGKKESEIKAVLQCSSATITKERKYLKATGKLATKNVQVLNQSNMNEILIHVPDKNIDLFISGLNLASQRGNIESRKLFSQLKKQILNKAGVLRYE